MLFGPDKTKTIKGVVRTKSLFYELSYTDTTHVIFTTKEEDIEVKGKTYLSLHKLYRSLVSHDPTEYSFATAVFGSWPVWEVIREAPQLKVHVAKWRREAEVKVKSEAILAIAEEMKSNGRSSFSAAKLLLDRGWIEKDTASKAKKKLREKEEEDLDREAIKLLDEDANRLGLKVH
jgi:hypothetical protein